MNNENMFGGSWLFAFLIIALLVGNGNGGLFGNNGSNVEAAVNAAVNNQSTQAGLRDILLATSNTTHDQTIALMQQNNTNLINAIQGFNQMNLTNANQFAEIRQQIAQLGYQMESCCCKIQTQMLQDKYEALERRYDALYTDKSNNDQSLYLLSVMGKWSANPAATA